MTLEELIAARLPQYQQKYTNYRRADTPSGSWLYDSSRLRYVTDLESGGGGWEGYGLDENGYGGWGYSGGPMWSDDTGALGISDGFLKGDTNLDEYVRKLARNDALSGTSYAGQWFDSAVDLIRQIDPNASEEDVFRAAQRVSAANPEPGQYMPRLRINELVANNYLSEKLGRPVTLSDNPQFAEAVASQEAMKHDGFSLREAWPYLAMFAGPWLSAVAGPALAGAIGGGTATTTSTMAANAAIQGGLGAAGAAATGGDVLEGAAVGAVTGGLGSAAPAIQGASQIGDFVGLTADQAKAVASATSAAVRAYASGGDPLAAAATALAGSVVGNMVGNFSLSDAARKIASSVGAEDNLITQVSDVGDDYDITTAELGQGLPSDNMNDFFADVINWDEGSDWLTGGDTTFADPGVWDESMATQAQALAAAGGYLNEDGSIGLPTEYQGSNPLGTGAGNMEGLGSAAPSENWLQYLRRAITSPAGQSLLKGGASAAAGGLASRSPLEMGLMTAPALAAIGYARNMTGPDTSRLESVYGQMDPAAALGAYDLQTNDRRSQLETNLARRGVMGSSFANDDLTTFNTTRDVGRRNLLQSGLESQAKVATDLAKLQDLGTQRKVDLYGRALNSLGLAFGGSRMMGG